MPVCNRRVSSHWDCWEGVRYRPHIVPRADPTGAYFSVGECGMKREIMATRPPVPPFTRETAIQKVRLAEDGWNSRDPEKVSLASSVSSNLKTEKSPANTCTGIMPA